jgi:hypothetical protein
MKKINVFPLMQDERDVRRIQCIPSLLKHSIVVMALPEKSNSLSLPMAISAKRVE